MSKELEGTDAQDVDFELGDRVLVLGGRYDSTRGRIYYIDEERIRILPDGVSDRLIEILLLPDEEGNVDLDPSLGIEKFLLLSKRSSPAFVAQINAHVGDLADTFSIGGEMGLTYTIQSVNEQEDSLVLIDETGGELRDIVLPFTGISLDAPFAVLRPRQPPLPVTEGADAAEVAEAAAAEAQENSDEFELIEEIETEMKGLQEIPSTRRYYPDAVQREELFKDMLQALDLPSQKNPKNQKAIRKIVELCMLLRNEVTRYSAAAEPIGSRSTSFQTIGELLRAVDVPLARPLLQAKRTLYLEHQDENDPIELPGKAVDIRYLADVLKESEEFLNSQFGGTTAIDSLPPTFLKLEHYFQRFCSLSIPDLAAGGEAITFMGDKEFLRAPGPTDLKEKLTDGLLLLPRNEKGKVVPATADYVGKVSFSLMKGLGPRSTRLRPKDPEGRRIESGDDGIMQGQILFPRATERSLGTTRSGRLAKDIAMSHATSTTMKQILQILGGIQEEATTGGILHVGPEGNTDGNVAIEDWLALQPFQIRGLGDALVELKNMGLAQKELTIEQQDILLRKLNQLRALLKQYITEERQLSIKGLSELRLTSQTFLQGEALEEFLAVLAEEPLLNQRVAEWKSQYPAYKDCDIGIFAGVSGLMADLLVTALAGLPGPLAKERNRRVRDQFLEALRAAMAKAKKMEDAGELPQPNKCPHVRDLLVLRKVQDDGERMRLLARFLAQYKGGREDNWITCAVCKQYLLCYHEELRIQEFLRPKEKDQLRKELLLAFSGGVFQSHYMCKNCGQAMDDLEFDMNMEFDDDGRPMMGRAALEDRDAAAEDALDQFLKGPGEAADSFEALFKTETQRLVYKVARQIFDRIGIYANEPAYKRLVTRVEVELQKQPTQEEYARIEEKKKAEAKAAGRPWKGVDYPVLINRNMVSIIGAHCLIEVQTHVPDLVLRYRLPGCRAGFTGYPMGREDEKTGIEYIACGIASIKKNETPWNLTGFLRISNEKARQDAIAKFIEGFVRESLKTAVVQQLLTEKRAYYQGIYGSTEYVEHLPETVPSGFRPVPYVITPEEAAQAIVVAAAATPVEQCRAWIQTAHRVARQNGVYVRGSPFSETSCCFTPAEHPRGFWGEKEREFPKLPMKTPLRGRVSSEVILPFKPRKAVPLMTEPPESLFYRVFLNVCFDGPRKGYPHEPGYTNVCANCGFVFPESPYMPKAGMPITSDKTLLKEYQADIDSILDKGKSALQTQQVTITRDTFNDVLDTIHNNFRVEMPEKVVPVAGVALLQEFADLTPEPFKGWREIMAATLEKIQRLPAKASEIDIAEAYGPLSDQMVGVIDEIQRRINLRSAETLRAIFGQSPAAVAETFRSYFLVPFQRLLTKFRTETLRVQRSYELSKETKDDIHQILDRHFDFMGQLQKRVTGYTATKLRWTKDRLAQVIPKLQTAIRAPFFPGGAFGTPYFVGALLGGILAEFMDPNSIPSIGAAEGIPAVAVGTLDTSARAPLQIVDMCLHRATVESLNFSEQQIRDLIAKKNEAEKLVFIGRFDKLSPEEKKVELMKKRLGLGEWAVGGTKAVYAYDPEQYEREREQRIDMGLGDFLPPETGGGFDDDAMGGGGAGAEDGYDNLQTREDDW